MKRIFQHPSEPLTGKKYWRSLGQLSDTPEFRGWLEREFPQGAAELQGGDVSRRNFLKLMGASTALAGLGLSACRRPEMHLVPFTRGVEWSIPGQAAVFHHRAAHRAAATRRWWRRRTMGARRRSRATRSIRSARARRICFRSRRSWICTIRIARGLPKDGAATDAAAFEKALDEIAQGCGRRRRAGFSAGGRQFADPRASARLRSRRSFPKVTWAVYEPLGSESADRQRAALARAWRRMPQFDKADVILSLDCDFLGDGRRRQHDPRVLLAPQGRRAGFEDEPAVCGRESLHDHRRHCGSSPARCRPARSARLRSRWRRKSPVPTNDAALAGMVKSYARRRRSSSTRTGSSIARKISWRTKGKSLVLAGARQPAAVQVLVAAINAALGNIGKTIVGRKDAAEAGGNRIAELAQQITDKKIKTLFIVGGNPVYNAPADLDWADVAKVGAHGGAARARRDETSKLATWNVPLAHYLEYWGDGRAADGSYVSVQPMILPLFGAWSELDLLAKVAGQPKPTGPELIQETFKAIAKPDGFRDRVGEVPARWIPRG